jgi:peptide/nickel transport system permease protein
MMTDNTNKEFSFKAYAWRQFKKNKPALISFYLLIFLAFVAIFKDFIATDQPLYAQYHGKTFYPAFQTFINPNITDSVKNPETGNYEKLQFDIMPWKQMKLDKVIWAPIPYSPDKPDRYNREYVGPFAKQHYRTPQGEIIDAPVKFRHHLGTNNIGQDIMAGLVHGTFISLTVGFLSVGIAAIIGIILGSLAGYFGDNTLRTSRATYYFTMAGIFLGLFYGFGSRKYVIGDALGSSIISGVGQIFISFALVGAIIFAFNFLGKMVSKMGLLNKKVNVPIDSFVSRSIEILNSMPKLLLIITIAAIAQRSLWLVMVIIGVTSWTGIARFTRAEFLRTRNLEFIAASKAMGFSEARTIFKHALPNSFAPVFIAIAFGIAAAILVESSLSFLGIGVPDDVVTWGSLLSQGRQEFEAWWMVVFPGFAIFLAVTVYNLIGEGLRDALDPRLKK